MKHMVRVDRYHKDKHNNMLRAKICHIYKHQPRVDRMCKKYSRSSLERLFKGGKMMRLLVPEELNFLIEVD